MASLYRKPVVITDPKTGRRIKAKSKKWWGRYRVADGRERRVPLAADKTAAETMLNDLVRKMEREKAGLVDPTENHRKRPLVDHIHDYRKNLVNRGSTEDYVNTTVQRIKAVAVGCKFERIDQISASRLQQYLADLRAKGLSSDGERPISIASSNHYLRAIKMFTRWLVRDRRTSDDRLAGLSAMNADIDRRRIRRPLSSEEFTLLVAAAERGPSIQRVSGPDRAVLYIVAAYTGYRRNEIGSVTAQSFDFESAPPTLTVEAGHSKHRRKDVLPLKSDFAERIKAWIAGIKVVEPCQPLFAIRNKRTAEMIEKDLAAARDKWIKEAPTAAERRRRERSSFLASVDHNGLYADFHSLRKTFITNLSRAGVSPKMAQSLARHSDINLTMNTYTMLAVQDQAAAVESLPPVPNGKPHAEALHAIATGNRQAVQHYGYELPLDLGRLLAVWNRLPDAIKTQVLTLVPTVG